MSAIVRKHRPEVIVRIGSLIILCVPAAALAHPWNPASTSTPLSQRVQPPAGFKRVSLAPNSFGSWLRKLPVLPGRPQVLLHNGKRKFNQSAHHLVFDIDVGKRDLQQCADAVMRLRAEYQWASGQRNAICFHFTNGHAVSWKRWSRGQRPQVDGRRFFWRPGKPTKSYRGFRAYMTRIFIYAGSASLSRELVSVKKPTNVMPGDVFIKGGFPGHAVIVIDVAENANGQRVFLLAQSYMPAQQIHLLRNPKNLSSPWYHAQDSGRLITPEWLFRFTDLKRFPTNNCVH